MRQLYSLQKVESELNPLSKNHCREKTSTAFLDRLAVYTFLKDIVKDTYPQVRVL